MCVGRGGEGGAGSWKPTERLLWSSRECGEGLKAESSMVRLVTGVVLLGGMGGEGLAAT